MCCFYFTNRKKEKVNSLAAPLADVLWAGGLSGAAMKNLTSLRNIYMFLMLTPAAVFISGA